MEDNEKAHSQIEELQKALKIAMETTEKERQEVGKADTYEEYIKQ